MNKKLLLIFMILSFTSIFAQNASIVGRVTDEDRMSLAGANIFIKELQKGTTTNLNGEFRLLNLSEGKYLLTISYIGYQPFEQEVNLVNKQVTKLNIRMKSGVVVGEEVLVVGERLKGQAKALNIQKTNSNITNIISSDQIGKFPDANIGDALKRIPGITVNYDQGEARFANVRGTEPRLNAVLINGERIPSAEASVRNVQLDLIPSDVIQNIELTKALTPEMEADAIGGSINLVTRQAPYDLRVSGTLGSGYNALSKKPIYTGAIVLSNRFFDDMVGAVISASYHNHDFGSHNAEGVWDKNDEGKFYVAEWDIRRYDLKRIRRSVTGALDFKLGDKSIITLSGIYNHRDDYENRFRVTYKLKEPDANGISKGSEIRRQTKGGSTDNDNRRLEDQRTSNIALSGDHVFFNNLKTDWSISFSKASEERPNERYIGWNVKKVDVKTNLADTKKPYFTESVGYDKFSLRELTEEFQNTDEKDFNAKLNLTLPLISDGKYKSNIKFGGRIKNKDKKRDNIAYAYELTDEGKLLYGNMSLIENKDYTIDKFLAGDYKSGNFTTAEYLGRVNLNDSKYFEKVNAVADYITSNYDASEKITAGYVQLNQNIGDNLLMIAGIRIENTNIDYKGFVYEEATESFKSRSGNEKYTNILPSINLKYDLDQNMILRFAWTNSLARPNYYDLVPYRNISLDDDSEVLEEGNSSLKATKSMNFDLMFENYFESIGIVSAGIFYKSINDFIYVNYSKNYTDPTTGKLYSKHYQPQNGADAKLFGLEFAFQRQLDFLPGIFKNFGIYANYTFTSSEAEFPSSWDNIGDETKLKLPGTAPHSLNLALNYQDSKLNAGLSFNYSSPYLDSESLDLTPGLERYYDKVTYLDFTASYVITKNIRIYAEANNLLNQPLRYYAGSTERTYQAEYYDRKFNFGVKLDL